MRPVAGKEHRDLTGGEELPEALGESPRAGGGLVELAVEVVEKSADDLGVGGLGAAYLELRHPAQDDRT